MSARDNGAACAPDLPASDSAPSPLSATAAATAAQPSPVCGGGGGGRGGATIDPPAGPLRHSSLWPMQVRFYEEAGTEGWDSGVVPNWITSNGFIASAYAAALAHALRDLGQPGPHEARRVGRARLWAL